MIGDGPLATLFLETPMLRIRAALALIFPLLAVLLVEGADGKYTIKEAASPAPAEIKEPMRKLLGNKSVQLLDAQGNVLGEFWFAREVPAKATPEQVKNGLTYRELDESTVIGA